MSATAVIFALELLNAGMLWWLPAAAAPLVIHLLSRLRVREMPWAAVDYLLAALRESRRRIRLEQWLLLLVRTLLVVLVVVAVAQPRVQSSGPVAAAGRKTHHVLVLDGSYSMAYQATDKRRFDQARQLAAQIVQQAPEGDAFSLVLLSDRPRIVVGPPAFHRDDFLKEVEQLELPHGGANLAKALGLVDEVLAMAKHEAHRLDRRQVCFLTDLHRVTWDVDRLDKAARDDFHKLTRRLAKAADSVAIDFGQRDAENVALAALRCAESLVTPGQPVEIRAELKDFGRQPHDRQPVEMLVDGSPVKQEHVALPPGGEAGVSFSWRFPSAGDHTVEVRALGDRLDVDNHRFLVVPVKQEIRVLCVDGRPSGEAAGGATSYLTTALAPQREGTGRALVRPEVVPESALLECRLSEYDCAILANVAQFTASEAKALDAYLRGGGNLIFFLGDQVRAENYNEQLGGGNPSGVRILPARLGPVVSQPAIRLDPLDYQHPIIRAFRSRENSGLLTTPIYRYFRLTLPETSKAQKVLMSGSDPVIVEEPVHRGRVILVATSADTSWDEIWTPLPLWPSFLPLVHEMLGFTLGNQLRERNLTVGQPLGGSFAVPASAAALAGRVSSPSYTVRPPDGSAQERQFQAEGEDAAWSYPETNQSGFYIAEFGPPISRSETFAVNVDPAESDLSAITAEELQGRVWPEITVVDPANWQQLAEQATAEGGRPIDLAQGLIYGALLLLVAETYLARRFGHHAP